MHSRSLKSLAAIALAAGVWIAQPHAATAQGTPEVHPVPQSLLLDHKETLERLRILAKRPGQVGAISRRALEAFKKHVARENEFILPPLTLLPYLADGKVTPDMKWALAMTDRVRAEREQIFQEHTLLTDLMNELIVAARKAHDNDAAEFAETAAADSLNDLEVLEPTILLIGDILRAKLPASN